MKYVVLIMIFTFFTPMMGAKLSSGYIFKDSSIKELTGQDLNNLSLNQLQFARNEIFAKKGHIFNSSKFKKYFKKKIWYKGDKKIEKTDLNSIELYNIALIRYFEGNFKRVPKPIKPKKYHKVLKKDKKYYFDLDGDGKKEKIVYKAKEGSAEIFINSKNMKFEFVAPYDTFAFIDINKNDKFKELIVSDYGYSDDYVSKIIEYRDKKIVVVGTFEAGYDGEIVYDQKGNIVIKEMIQFFQTMFVKTEYLLKNGKFLVNNPLSQANSRLFLKNNIPVYKVKGGETTTLQRGQVVKLISVDKKQWAKIYVDGKYYWLEIKDNMNLKITDKPLTHYFIGLVYAG